MLLDLVHEWVGILNDEGAAQMAEIRTNLPRTYFAWSGPTAPGSVAYFRVQGPTLVISTRRSRATSNTSTRSIAIPRMTTAQSW